MRLRILAIAALVLSLVVSPSFAFPATAAPAAVRHAVTLVAVSSSPATITYAGNGVVVQKTDHIGTWTRTFSKHSYTYYSVTVSAFDGGSVTCKIKVDGKVKRQKSASGDYASVDCTL